MRYLLALLLFVSWLSSSQAADWPQWLGPTRNANSTEKITPWKEAPKTLWKVPVGEGHSSPIVSAGKVYLHSKVAGKETEIVRAFDLATGKPAWDTEIKRGPFNSLFGNGPRATPTVHDGKVYTLGITGWLTCLDADKGTILWEVDTLTKFSGKNLKFGVSCSPLIEGDLVLVNVGAKGASLVAFHKKTGEVVWQAHDDGASYSSPVALGAGAGRQLLFFTAEGLKAVHPKDGALLWQYPLKDKLLESSSTPTLAGDLLLASAITVGSAGLKLQSEGGKPTAKEAWKNADLTCYFSTPIALDKDHFFVVTGANPLALKIPQANLHCIDAKTGKALWSQNKVGKYHATLLRLADNNVLLVEDNGTVVLLEPSTTKYTELARAKVCGDTWSHPALSAGKLIVRDEKELLCVELSK